MKYSRGFTFIEMIIAVAIVAILAAIAIPSYQQHVRKTKRVEMQSELLEIASKLQQFKAVHRTFTPNSTDVALSDLGYASDHNGIASFPENGAVAYKVSIENVTQNSWLLIAITDNGQKGDGTLGLDSKGQKCWTPQNDLTSCTPDGTSNWEGR